MKSFIVLLILIAVITLYSLNTYTIDNLVNKFAPQAAIIQDTIKEAEAEIEKAEEVVEETKVKIKEVEAKVEKKIEAEKKKINKQLDRLKKFGG